MTNLGSLPTTWIRLLRGVPARAPASRKLIVRTLADLRHVCDFYTFDMGKLDRRAYSIYLEERSHCSEMTLDVAQWAWKDHSEAQNGRVLSATVSLGNVPHEVKAFEVEMTGNLQFTTDPDAQAEFEQIHATSSADVPYVTVKIHGRHYALYITPQSR